MLWITAVCVPVVRKLKEVAVVRLTPSHNTAVADVTQVNSALHPHGVDKSSTSFGWGEGGKATYAG